MGPETGATCEGSEAYAQHPAGFEIEGQGQGRAARANQPQTTGDGFQTVTTRKQEEKGDNSTRDTQRGHQEGRSKIPCSSTSGELSKPTRSMVEITVLVEAEETCWH
jgi:hypothetical protein